MPAITLFFFLIAIPMFAADIEEAPSPGMKPVPANQLDGLRLKLPNSLGSIAAPAANWKWFVNGHVKSPAYWCISPDLDEKRKGFVIVYISAERLDKKAAQEVLDEEKESITSSGWKFTDGFVKESDIPFVGKSFCCTCAFILKDGTKRYSQKYLALIDKTLIAITSQSSDAAESTEFNDFVKSLKPGK